MIARVAEHISAAVDDEPLISVGESTLDRMPALAMIFEKAATNFTRSLEEFCDAPAAMAIDDLHAKRAADLPAYCRDLPLVFVFQADGLSSKAAVAIDGEFCELCVELLLGSGIFDQKQERQHSKIDLRLAAFLVERLLEGFATALQPIAMVEFHRDYFADEIGLSALGQKSAIIVAGRYRLSSFERQGCAAILFPRAALDPYRAALSKLPGAEERARDARWSENLYDHVVRTEVKIDVKIEARNLSLGDIASLEVGDVLRLPIAPTSPIRIESEGRTLFWCTLGQKDGRYTVRLEDFSDGRQSMVENILGV
ncbi:MAG: FliM/FliN family flagellar motor switch protein [Methylocystis sp.]|nr:FliM/FliN family flagellar motor switch protein [Methylocystis sp.]